VSDPLHGAGQLLLVTAASWDSPRGQLVRLVRPDPTQRFVRVGAPLPVWLGRHGLAWRSDAGAPEPPVPGPRKREGDGRSPAGILPIGEMWGYAPAPPSGVRLTYHQAGPRDRCVDDAQASEYGRLTLAPPSGPPPWRSAEELRLPTEHYRYLAVLRYNMDRPLPGAGSCIFLHVAPAPEGPTAGCTALREGDLLTVLRWLDPAKRPLLVQVPTEVLRKIQKLWRLPPELVQSEASR
jgi:D-alanyl-D-alanine dipeptidase